MFGRERGLRLPHDIGLYLRSRTDVENPEDTIPATEMLRGPNRSTSN